MRREEGFIVSSPRVGVGPRVDRREFGVGTIRHYTLETTPARVEIRGNTDPPPTRRTLCASRHVAQAVIYTAPYTTPLEVRGGIREQNRGSMQQVFYCRNWITNICMVPQSGNQSESGAHMSDPYHEAIRTRWSKAPELFTAEHASQYGSTAQSCSSLLRGHNLHRRVCE